MGFGGFLGGVGVVGSKITFERFDRFSNFFHEKMRKDLGLNTSDDGHCAVAMEKVLCNIYEKLKKVFPFFMRHFYSMNNLGSIITQDCVKHCYGCYGMPHVALGYPEPPQSILQVLNFDCN